MDSTFLCHTSMKGSREQTHADRQLNTSVVKPTSSCAAANAIGRNTSCYSNLNNGVPFWVKDKQFNSREESSSCASKMRPGSYSL